MDVKLFRAVRHFVRSSLSRQFVLVVVIVNVALTTMLGWELIDRDLATLDQYRATRAKGIAQLVAANGAPALARDDRVELLRLAKAATGSNSVNYIVFQNADGRVVAHTRTGAGTNESFLRPTFAGESQPRLLSRSEEAFLAAAPVQWNESRIGSVQVSVTRRDLADAQREIGMFVLLYGAAVVLLGGLVAFLTARSVTERLAKLAIVADRFRLGEHHARLKDDRPDEVGSVARGVNAMLETLTASERSLNDVFRFAHIGSWRFAPSSSQLTLSQTAHELFGLDGSTAPTAEAFRRVLSSRQQRNLTRLLDSDDADRTFSFNFTVPGPNGSRRICWAEARAERCQQTGERVLVGICQDITERETAIAQLRQAQKMEAVGQLTGGLAHDFNNLLAIVIGNLDLLEEEFTSGSHARECIEEALAAALRGSELTRQLLAFSRRQPLSPKEVDLNELVAGMSTLWRRTLTESIEVRVHLSDSLRSTKVDPTQVESAILNLVINARDAMPNGGVLTVETANVSIEESEWGDSDERDVPSGDYVIVAVSDTGTGMPPDVAARAFEPFFTTKPVGMGSGLGLSMIYGFAKQSGGTVKIYSELEQGTTVRLYLPASSIGRIQTVEMESAASMPLAANETVLLVEDNDSVRRVAARQLEELGYSVLTANDGQEALAILEEGEGIDLLFTDVVMPGGMNGFELGQIALTLNPKLKILHTSGFTRPAAQENIETTHALELLTYPYRKIDLAVRLRQVLDTPNASGS